MLLTKERIARQNSSQDNTRIFVYFVRAVLRGELSFRLATVVFRGEKNCPFSPILIRQPKCHAVFTMVLYTLHYNAVFQWKQILQEVKSSDCSKRNKQTMFAHLGRFKQLLSFIICSCKGRHALVWLKREDTCFQDTGFKTACLDCSLRYIPISSLFDSEKVFSNSVL